MGSCGDIFTSGAEAIVIPTNCIGTQGAGLARQAAKRWPAWSRHYTAWCSERRCTERRMMPGQVHTYRTGFSCDPQIIAVATKDHWRDPSRIEWIESGIESITEVVLNRGFTSIAIPALGCGLGGLDWNDVRPLIEAAAERMPGTLVMIYGPREG
jgi:O-acetyl-ADP-ribose deacetylase (regulator of RNase III)